MDTAEKRQHLEFNRNINTRMNTNSFQLKGIAIAIVSALPAICASAQNVIFVFFRDTTRFTVLAAFSGYIVFSDKGFVLKYNCLAF